MAKTQSDAPTTTALAKQSTHVLERINAFTTKKNGIVKFEIANSTQLESAVNFARLAETWCENAHASWDPVVETANTAHKTAVAKRREFIDPVEKPLAGLKAEIFRFNQALLAENRRAQLEAENNQRKLNAKAATAAVAGAKKAGADTETLKEIAEVIKSTPAPIVELAAPVGLTGRTLWDVDREKYSLYELCQAIVALPEKGNHLLELIEPNFKNLKSRATSGKDKAVIPGFTVVSKASGSL
jgi:hypothetical protein